jgi:hypothetical protein
VGEAIEIEKQHKIINNSNKLRNKELALKETKAKNLNKVEKYFIKEFTNGKCASTLDGLKS